MPTVNGDLCPISIDVMEPGPSLYEQMKLRDQEKLEEIEYDSPLHYIDHKEQDYYDDDYDYQMDDDEELYDDDYISSPIFEKHQL